jgi:hypothetical protein
MQADQKDTTGVGGAAPGKNDEISEPPIEMVLIDPFGPIAAAGAEFGQVRELLTVATDALENVTGLAGLDADIKRRIESVRRAVIIAEERLAAALGKLGAGETMLYEARVPQQFRGMA